MASSSLLYLALPIIMGLLLRYTKLTIGWATMIFLPLVGVAIWAGQKIPFDHRADFRSDARAAAAGLERGLAGLLFRRFGDPDVAAVTTARPFRGYFLYLALGGGMLGVLFGNGTDQISRIHRLGFAQRRGSSSRCCS